MNNERQAVMIAYNHIQAWIAGCHTTEQLCSCQKAIDNFDNAYGHSEAMPTLKRDLEVVHSQRLSVLSRMELINIKCMGA